MSTPQQFSDQLEKNVKAAMPTFNKSKEEKTIITTETTCVDNSFSKTKVEVRKGITLCDLQDATLFDTKRYRFPRSSSSSSKKGKEKKVERT